MSPDDFWPKYRELRAAFYASKEWKILARLVRASQDMLCDHCKKKKRLDVHHKQSLFDRPDLAMNYFNLVGICRDCHKEIHGY